MYGNEDHLERQRDKLINFQMQFANIINFTKIKAIAVYTPKDIAS